MPEKYHAVLPTLLTRLAAFSSLKLLDQNAVLPDLDFGFPVGIEQLYSPGNCGSIVFFFLLNFSTVLFTV